MVCIEKGSALTFDIDYRVRLIDASEYDIGSYVFLKGFISGLHAGNFDISHIFIDGLYKLSGSNDAEETAAFLAWCESFGMANKLEFTISISDDPANLPESITKYRNLPAPRFLVIPYTAAARKAAAFFLRDPA